MTGSLKAGNIVVPSATRIKMLLGQPKNGNSGDKNGLGKKSVSLLTRALPTSLVKTGLFNMIRLSLK